MKTDDLYRKITDTIIDRIREGSAGKWEMPWQALAGSSPVSAAGRPYRGVNSLYLSILGADHGYRGVWATYKQWGSYGAQVRKGEKGTAVFLWKPVERKDKTDDDGKPVRGMIATTFTVFAAEQCDGADERAEQLRPTVVPDGPEAIEHAEKFFAAVGADVRTGGDRAYYTAAGDYIRVPERAAFRDAASYYSTLAHEHVHWTGNAARLDRQLGNRFGTEAYAAEELVAELGAAFWCGQYGITDVARADHAAYVANWLTVLRNDHKAIVTAASKAQQAVDYLTSLAGE